MTSDRHRRVKDVFLAACGRDGDERRAYLDEAGGHDSALRAQIESLLSEDAASSVIPGGPQVIEIAGHDPGASALPESIGGYRILRVLGAGGMGVVYEAEQQSPRRRVALKVIRRAWASPELLRRFEHEAEVLGRLRHAGIAQVHEAGRSSAGDPFFAMELVDGQPLIVYGNEKQLGLPARLELFIKVCTAVHYAHQHGVIHRDLKPANILIDAEGQPKILDFGIARVTESDLHSVTMHTQTGQLIGTIPYMSPEQASGDPDGLDTRSDVYALGVLLYELLSHKLPYDLGGVMLHEAVRIIREEEPSSLSTADRRLGGDLETIARKALEKDKDRRYSSAAELAADVRRYLSDEPIIARRASALYQFRKFARRNRALVTGLVAVSITLIGAAAVSLWFAIESGRSRDEAREQAKIAEAINEFLNRDLLKAVDPFQGRRDVRVREVLDSASHTIENRFSDRPRVEAALRLTLGETYTGLGEYESAEPHVRRALALYRALHGDEHVEVATALHALGMLSLWQGRHDEAERHLLSSLETRTELLGADDDDVIASLNHLGLLYLKKGPTAEAERYLERALETQLRMNGELEAETIAIQNNLANAFCDLGRYDEAEALYLRSDASRRQLYGEGSPRGLAAVDGLALVYTRVGRNEEAERLYRQVVEMNSDLYGPEHSRTLGTQARLGNVYVSLGQLARAEALLSPVLDIRRRTLGEKPPETLQLIRDLGMLHRERGAYDDALRFYQEALTGQTEVLGLEHADTAATLSHLGSVYLRLSRYAEARTHLEQALEIQGRLFDEVHPAAVSVKGNLARVLLGLGELDRAEKLAREAYEAAVRTQGADSVKALTSGQSLGQVFHSQKRYDEAETLWESILPRMRARLGDEDAMTIMTTNNLAYLYDLTDRPAEAEPLYRRILETQRRIAGDEHPRVFIFMVNLAQSYLKQKKYDEAERAYREFLEALRQARGEKFVPLLNFYDGFATVYVEQDRRTEAERIYTEMYAFSVGACGADDRATQQVIGAVARFYDQWNKPDKAAEWRAKLQTSGGPG